MLLSYVPIRHSFWSHIHRIVMKISDPLFLSVKRKNPSILHAVIRLKRLSEQFQGISLHATDRLKAILMSPFISLANFFMPPGRSDPRYFCALPTPFLFDNKRYIFLPRNLEEGLTDTLLTFRLKPTQSWKEELALNPMNCPSLQYLTAKSYQSFFSLIEIMKPSSFTSPFLKNFNPPFSSVSGSPWPTL